MMTEAGISNVSPKHPLIITDRLYGREGSKMKYRKLGWTGERISAVWDEPGVDDSADKKEMTELLPAFHK